MYQKLRIRLNAFYVNAEKHRLMGPTSAQTELYRKTGYSFDYRAQLHKCLKKLMFNVIDQRDPFMQETYLKEVYFWFYKKLMSMGALSHEEMQEESKIMNPSKGK